MKGTHTHTHIPQVSCEVGWRTHTHTHTHAPQPLASSQEVEMIGKKKNKHIETWSKEIHFDVKQGWKCFRTWSGRLGCPQPLSPFPTSAKPTTYLVLMIWMPYETLCSFLEGFHILPFRNQFFFIKPEFHMSLNSVYYYRSKSSWNPLRLSLLVPGDMFSPGSQSMSTQAPSNNMSRNKLRFTRNKVKKTFMVE